MRRILCSVLALALLCLACGENTDYASNNDTEPTPVVFTLEDEPTLSIDGDWLYFVGTDTLLPARTGIYRARIGNPVRELVLAGNGLHSPSEMPDGNRVAFLSGSSLNILILADTSVISAGLSGVYSSVTCINDTTLIACLGQLLFWINLRNSSVSRIADGYDPVYYQQDEFLYVKELSPGNYGIVSYSFQISHGEYLGPEVQALDTIRSGLPVRWVSADPESGRYAYLAQGIDSSSVYTSTIGSDETHSITRTVGTKPLLIGFNTVLYRGPDGRLYQSDFRGTTSIPYWSVQ